MSKALQAKLLRALESGEVRRIGENESRRADVRFVAATNIDLKAAIEAGDFRSDLYYRLNVHRIHMPPLRERGEDVRVLVDHFVARFGREAGVERCGDDAWALLSAYDFPGNVRQLEHIIQRAVASHRVRSFARGLTRGGCRTAGADGRLTARWPRDANAPTRRRSRRRSRVTAARLVLRRASCK